MIMANVMSTPKNVMRRSKTSHSFEFVSHCSLLRFLMTKLSLLLKLLSSLKLLPRSLRARIFLLSIEICWLFLILFILILILFVSFLFFRLRLRIRMIVEIIMGVLTGIWSVLIISMARVCLSWLWLSAMSLLIRTGMLCCRVGAMIILIIVAFEFFIREDLIGLLYLSKLFFPVRIYVRMKSFYQFQIWVLQNFLIAFDIDLQYFIIVFWKIYGILSDRKRKNHSYLSWKHWSIKKITLFNQKV